VAKYDPWHPVPLMFTNPCSLCGGLSRNVFPSLHTFAMCCSCVSTQAHQVWAFIWLLDIIQFGYTFTITLLVAMIFDHVQEVEQTWPNVRIRLWVVFVTGVIIMAKETWRALCWRWIKRSEDRIWRHGLPSILADAIWSGVVLVMLPFGFQSSKAVETKNMWKMMVRCMVSNFPKVPTNLKQRS